MVEKFKIYKEKLFSGNTTKKYLIGGAVVATLLIGGVASTYKTITITIDGKATEVATFKTTVKGVLNKNLIELSEKDKVTPDLDARISKNDVIDITRAKDISVEVDGQGLQIQSAEANISDMLAAEGITINELDRVEPGVETEISEGLDVKITRVEERVITQSQAIEYETVVKNDESLDNTVVKTIQEGVQGEKQITLKVTLENGQEVDRKVIEEKIVKEPVEKQVVKGTMNTLVLSRGETLKYKKKMVMEATAYSGDTITATGTVPKRNPSGLSTIAVDPRVIPLGTKVYIEGYGYAVAEDTGGAIKKNIIDLFLNSSQECYNWGRRNVNLYIVAYPGEW